VHFKLSLILNHISQIENIGFHIEDYVFQTMCLCFYCGSKKISCSRHATIWNAP